MAPSTALFGGQLNSGPAGVRNMAFDPDGALVVADAFALRVRRLDFAGGTTVSLIGTGLAGDRGSGGAVGGAQLVGPRGLGVDANGDIYVADQLGQTLWRLSSADDEATQLVGNGGFCFSNDDCGDGGTGLLASTNPYDVVPDGMGGAYFAEIIARRVRHVDAGGMVSTVLGTGSPCSDPSMDDCGDGGQALDADLFAVRQLARFDDQLFVATLRKVRRVDLTTGIVSTVVGDGAECAMSTGCGVGGPALDASLQGAAGISVGPDGTLYVADGFQIYSVDLTAVTPLWERIAGDGTQCVSSADPCGDGGDAASAQLDPRFIEAGPDGSVFIGNFSPSRPRVLRFESGSSTWTVTSLSTTHSSTSFSGDGGLMSE
ncbi:MAG: hypothetical protein AAFY60_19780, partial [Myxococcota bacterium]